MPLRAIAFRIAALLALAVVFFARVAAAEEPAFDLALAPGGAPKKPRGFVIESIDTALTAYQQDGLGYQSKANSQNLLLPGSQRLLVFQPQVLVVARQNRRIVHRFWFPIDMVTAASPNATDRERRPPDVMSNASRQNQAFTFDWNVGYEAPRPAGAGLITAAARNAVHIEENFRSWTAGLGTTVSFAEDAATVSANANQVFDWFSRYDVLGHRLGRTNRATTNGNAGITQILTSTTVVHANYGVSAQLGQMSNTWNSVPLSESQRVQEHLPDRRIRHALVGRFAQWLPWNGALKGSYRFYTDTWSLVAHTVEAQLLQRLSPSLYVRGSYRFYTQTGVGFFTTAFDGSGSYFTADSDLARFDAHSVGGKVSVEVPMVFEGAHLDAGYERYWRSDGLAVNVALWQAGARF